MRPAQIAVMAVAAWCFAGCAPTPSTTADDSREQLTESEREPPAPGFLVQYPIDEQVVTTWIASSSEGYEEVATRTAAYGVFGDALWHWTTVQVELGLADCGCLSKAWEEGREDTSSCVSPAIMDVPALENAETGETVRFGDWERLKSVGEVQVSATNRGIVGDQWFGTTCTYMYPCGAAHGSVGCRSFVADPATGELSELHAFMGADDYDTVENRLKERAVASFEESSSDPTGVTEAESAELDAGWPMVTPDGLSFVYVFVAPTCYACSDGSWSSYSVAVELQDDTLPERIEPKAVPDAVSAFLRAKDLETSSAVGWSRLPEDPRRRTELLQLFEQRYEHTNQTPEHGDDDD